jgi:hypothetical protein
LSSIDLAPLEQARRREIADLIATDRVSRFTNCATVLSGEYAICRRLGLAARDLARGV